MKTLDLACGGDGRERFLDTNNLNILSYFSALPVGTLPEKQTAAEFYKNSSCNSAVAAGFDYHYPKLMISKIIWRILKINKFNDLSVG